MIDVLETLAVKIRANESQMRELAGTETFADPVARCREVSAVARGLAVTMLALLKHPEREYKALSDDKRIEWEAAFGPIPEPGERIRIMRSRNAGPWNMAGTREARRCRWER